MISGARGYTCAASALTLTMPDNDCGVPINSTYTVGLVVTAGSTALPANDAEHWTVQVVSGDTPPDMVPGTFVMRICVISKAADANIGAGNYIQVSNSFPSTISYPKPTVSFWNQSGWVNLKVYVTDGTTLVSGTLRLATSVAMCSAASSAAAAT